ncbi:YegS/Rv2252/BmrU family lipid kinase [Acetivibrio cellulolyticus]|uniref:YegS/Rv2252/BmrU family lipid kinase n=1 Tax=Acetivibrio cellulolyticus TaxID=35830 RepID=UPI0001E2FBF5
MDQAILVYNPLSGDRSIQQKLDHIISRFQKKGILLQPFRIIDDDHNVLKTVLERNDYKFVVASGGDGTLNHISNLMLKSGIKVPLGIIPSGTCNDFAAILNIPSDLDQNIDIILKGKTVKVDVGLINEENYFLSSCAGGVFVEVSFNTDNELKKNFGPFAYYLKALSEVANMKSVKLTLKTDKETIEEEALMFVIINGRHVAGFSNIVKEADYADGLMDIAVVKNCKHIDLASIFFKVLSNESISNKNVITLKAKSCEISSDRDMVLSVDGEKGPNLPVKVRFIKKALKVFAK